MWNYYKQVALDSAKGMLTKGPIIFGLIKGLFILLPSVIGTIAIEELWTFNGFKENWPWIVIPTMLILFLFWSYGALKINYETVEIIQPNLIVDYKEGEQSYQQWDQMGNHPNMLLLHRIRIFNDGRKPLQNIYVQINSINPEPTPQIRGLPIKLHVMGHDSAPMLNDSKFDLDGEADAFVDLISLGRRNQVPGNLLFPVGSYPSYQNIHFEDNTDYDLNISVFAEGTKYCDKQFQLKSINDQTTPVRRQLLEM